MEEAGAHGWFSDLKMIYDKTVFDLIIYCILYVSVINISCKQKTHENNLKVKDIIVMYVIRSTHMNGHL